MSNQNMIDFNANYGNANRQYIGARYVPKFFQNPNGTAEWVGNVPYEALTIVTYLGNSYTSKITVPSGIGSPNNNPTYWALTGNYNAQVEEYRHKVIEIEQETDNNTQSISELTSAFQNKNKKPSIILISDSFGGGYTDGQWGNGWYYWISQYLQNTYNVIYPVSAPDVGNRCFSNGSWLSDLKFVNTTTTDTNENVKIIAFIGGTNEINNFNVGEIQSGMSACAKYARDNFPNAQILLLPALSNFNFWYNSLQPVYKNCQLYGLEFINTQMTCMNQRYISSDKTHLTQEGYQTIAAALANAILTKSCHFHNSYKYPAGWFTAKNGVTGNLGQLGVEFNEDRAYFYFSGTLVKSTSTVSGTIVLGDVNMPIFFPLNSRMHTCSVYYTQEGNLKASYDSSVFINNNNELVLNYVNTSPDNVTTVINFKDIPLLQLPA